MNGVSGKDSLVGINAARISEAIPLKPVPTLWQFYTARYGRGAFFFFVVGVNGEVLFPPPISKPGILQTSRKRQRGRKGGGNHTTHTHRARKRNVNAPQPSPPDSLRKHQMHASYAAQSRPTWPRLHKAASPARPAPSGRPFDGNPEPPSGSLS